MKSHHVLCKLGNMRKLAEFTVYPRKPEDKHILIQSDTRICMFDPEEGTGMLSAAVQNGARFIHLRTALGATKVTIPADVIAACLDSVPVSGTHIGCGVYVA